MRFVFYAFAAVAIGLVWLNYSTSGRHVLREMTANHEPEWKRS